jgi:cytochrome P450
MLRDPHPLLGHLKLLGRDKIAFLEHTLRESNEHGLIRVASPIGPTVLFARTPEVLHEVMVEKADVIGKSYILRFGLYPLAGEGLFTSQWNTWKPNRRLMAPLFHPSVLGTYAADMVKSTEATLKLFRDGEVRAIFDDTNRITMSIAAKTLFDADTFEEAESIGDALTVGLGFALDHGPSAFAIAHVWTRALLKGLAARSPKLEPLAKVSEHLHGPLFLPGKKGRAVKEAVALLDAHVAKMIADRRKKLADPTQAPPNDLLSKLLQARDEGGQLSEKQVRDEVLTLFIAGHETTATGLAWSLYLLCKHPDIYAKVQAEVDAAGQNLGIESLAKLPLTLRVFKEALRLYPPVYIFGRQALRATEVQGLAVEAHTVVLVSPYALHRNPNVWPDPLQFDPDRFLPEAESKRHRLAWLPFGAGPRICIGNHFALMEAQLVLAKMLQYASFDLAGEEEPLAFATLRPKHGVRLKVSLHNPRSTVARSG